MKEQVHSASLHFRKNAWSWNDKTVKIIVTARLAWFVGGLRSCPLPVVCDRMDPVLVPRVGDRFTQRPGHPAGFAMTIRTRYVIGRLAWFVGGLRSCPPLVVFCVHAILRFTSGGSLHASLRPARQVRDDEKRQIVMASGTIFAKMLGVGMTK